MFRFVLSIEMKHASRLLYIAGILSGALLVIACSGSAPPFGATATPSNPPAATPSPAATGESTYAIPSVTPQSTAISATSTILPSGFHPMSIHMVDKTDGWATGGDGDVRTNSILHTTDGGITWTDITPSGIDQNEFLSAYFLDATHAWTAITSANSRSDIPPQVTVLRTTDAGKTWSAGQPLPLTAEGAAQLDFVDPLNGWMMADLGVAAGSMAVAFYQTSDGGIHWQQVSLTSGINDQSTPGSLPLGCDKNGFAFINTTRGWAAGSCAGGPAFFYLTDDGGRTWQRQPLPPPPGLTDATMSQCQCDIKIPVVVSQFVAVQVRIPEVQGSFLYTSRDAGKTWSPFKLPVADLLGGPAFVDSNNGWVTDGHQVYATADGGSTWKSVGGFPAADLRGSLNFVSTQDGWFTDGQQLYATHDGGQTWSVIHTTVVSAPTSVPPATTVTPAPLASPTPATAMLYVTLTNEGQTIVLNVGQMFVLSLGTGRTWTVHIQDPTVVAPAPVAIPLPLGAQGYYRALRPGRTALTATGDLPCRFSSPPCLAPTLSFAVTLVVQ